MTRRTEQPSPPSTSPIHTKFDSVPDEDTSTYGRVFLNPKDLFRPPWKGRRLARSLWVITVLGVPGVALAGAGVYLNPMTENTIWVAFFALAGTVLCISALTALFLPVWPVMVSANQCWVRRGVNGNVIAWMMADPQKVRVYYVRPALEYVQYFFTSRPIEFDLSNVPPIIVGNMPLYLTGGLEYRFDPSSVSRERWNELLVESIEDRKRDLRVGMFDAFRNVSHDVMRQFNKDGYYEHVVPALMQECAHFFEQAKQDGFVVEPNRSLIYVDIPPEIASAHYDEWAEQARARASTMKLEAFVDALQRTDSPSAATFYRLTDGRARVRMSMRDADLLTRTAQEPLNQGKPLGGWVERIKPGAAPPPRTITGSVVRRDPLPSDDDASSSAPDRRATGRKAGHPQQPPSSNTPINRDNFSRRNMQDD